MRRMVDDEIDFTEAHAIRGLQCPPHGSCAVSKRAQFSRGGVRRYRHSFPHFEGPEVAKQARGAADVTHAAMRAAHVIGPPHPKSPDRGGDDATADIKRR